jgi:hypothetical protein
VNLHTTATSRTLGRRHRTGQRIVGCRRLLPARHKTGLSRAPPPGRLQCGGGILCA